MSTSPSSGAPGTRRVSRKREVVRTLNDEGLPPPLAPLCCVWRGVLVPGGEQGSLRPHFHRGLINAGSRGGRMEVHSCLGSHFFKRSQKFRTFGHPSDFRNVDSGPTSSGVSRASLEVELRWTLRAWLMQLLPASFWLYWYPSVDCLCPSWGQGCPLFVHPCDCPQSLRGGPGGGRTRGHQ